MSALNVRDWPTFSRLIGVEEHDDEVRFKTGSRNMAVSCMRNITVIIGTVRSLWTWLWDRYHVPQNV